MTKKALQKQIDELKSALSVEFLVRLHDLAKECDVAIKVDDHGDAVMLPTYKKDGSLDEWFVIGVNPYRRYDFKLLTQETQ